MSSSLHEKIMTATRDNVPYEGLEALYMNELPPPSPRENPAKDRKEEAEFANWFARQIRPSPSQPSA